MNILDEHVWIPVIMGRSFVEGFGFTLCFDLSRSRDLDLLYDLLCLSRSRSRSLSLSLDFTLSRSTDLRIFRKFNVCECQRYDKSTKKKSSDVPSSSFSRTSSSSISVAITFSGSIPPSSWRWSSTSPHSIDIYIYTSLKII